LLRVLARRASRPSVIGMAYVLALSLWAAQRPTLDEREGGSEARQIDAVVHGHFGGEIVRMGAALAGAAIVAGALFGCLAAGLIALRDRLGPPPVSPTRPHGRQLLLVAILVATLHGAVELWAMARHPQLYAGAFYARGGVLRTVQILATDVLGPAGVYWTALVACAAFVAGRPSRWPMWPDRASRAAGDLSTRLAALVDGAWGRRRVVAVGASVCGGSTLLLIAALSVARTPFASARSPMTPPGEGERRSSGLDGVPEPRPNVLILAADSLRADRLDPRTAPHLSALAARATRFDKAYVSLPRTFPSWVTVLTGRYPHHHGIRSMFPRWEERARDFDALPERLARAGWSTAVVSDYAGDIFSRIDLGFGNVDVPQFDFRQLVRQRAIERETPLLPMLDTPIGRAAFPVLREMNDAADPSILAGDAVRAMRALESRGPFFLVVFFSTAHFPYAAPAPYYGRFTDPEYRGRYKYFRPVGLGRDLAPNLRDQGQIRGLYDGAVSAIDDAAQTVLDALARDGLAGRTVVVVTADHGETLFDHGHGQGHGDHLLGDEGTHVPLVIFDPRRAANHREPSVVRDVDIAPTLYALTGVPPPGDLDGRSLADALDGRPMTQAVAYGETGLWFTEEIAGLPRELRLPYPGIARLTEVDTQHGDEVVLKREMRALTIVAKHRMLRDARWKLLYVPARSGVRWLLFDTVDDPGEERDVAAAHPDVLARLKGELWAWMRSDPDMTERGGYLVPRDVTATAARAIDTGTVRLDEGAPGDEQDPARAPGVSKTSAADGATRDNQR
jgi:arylsulfatase A-like enzyme